ncbi:MAG: GNAT family N-acetyltransferase [Candidatus Thiodiazotropha sp. (ex Gloverina cf. vestifex)]|nr:GNAT family N-acetyltransferase [Candidatus Thiodiazotropha sp. (ex Gloverina cf. vestifex)]
MSPIINGGITTRSYHWIANPQFSTGIGSFLHRERQVILDYKKTLQTSSPYRQR